MMKISDPIMFGHCVRVFFKDAFEKHADVLEDIGVNPNNGLGALLAKVRAELPGVKAAEILADFDACYEDRPWLAMVNSDKGITNLVRSVVLIANRGSFDFSAPNSHGIHLLLHHSARSFGYHYRCVHASSDSR